ncbi:MAG TPA: DUF1080 domain-containing protein [Pirellulales bacterium]|nr:DUF1080 domain-containing protein [Pirellulales bacterium]
MKVVGGLFATVVAPIVVAIGVKYTDAVVPPPDPATNTSVASSDKQPSPASISAGPPAEPQPQSPSPPTPPPAAESQVLTPNDAEAPPAPTATLVRLFNGRDLGGFYTFLGPPKADAKPLGRNRDPKRVFSVRGGLLRISGQIDGGLVTEREYANYKLTVEYRWGQKTWPPKERAARTSGILLHCVGRDGGFQQRWLTSIKCQIKEGTTGDFVVFPSQGQWKPSVTVEADRRDIEKNAKRLVLYRYMPGAPLTTLSTGFVVRAGRDPGWKDEKGFRGADGLELPPGEWNTLECICQNDTITVRLNGQTVNVGTAVRPKRGRIMLQSNGAEIFFRRVDLEPLGEPSSSARRDVAGRAGQSK